jgi:regulator of sigma E protease
MDIVVLIVQFVIGLLIIVGIHELGHLLFAKLFGIRVESYGIGMPPKLIKFIRGETEYYIGALPIGGSVKLSGMADEYLEDQETDYASAQPWEYRAKPAWQRLIVILGGIVFNLLSGILIYSTIAWYIGDKFLSKEEVNKYGIVPNDIAMQIGFQEGDKIININGSDFVDFAEVLNPKSLLVSGSYYTIDRNGIEQRIYIPRDLDSHLLDQKSKSFLLPRVTYIVGKVIKDSEAQKAGLLDGDQILEIDGVAVPYFHILKQALTDKSNKDINLSYKRGDEIFSTKMHVSTVGTIGIEIVQSIKYADRHYGLFESIKAGISKAYNITVLNLIGIKKIITGKVSASKALSGPIGIAQIFGTNFSMINFWNIIGFLSVIIAITNLLPIPALDGGHAVLLMYEIVTRKRVSSRFLMLMQKVGVALLLALAVYTTVNDVLKTFF